jgi:hypothetical protein
MQWSLKYSIVHVVSAMSCLPLHDITRKGLRWPGTGPTPRTNHQAEDRATVQDGTGSAESSGGLPEQKLQGKTEYSNTQQGLPGHSIHRHVTRLMKGFQVLGRVFS